MDEFVRELKESAAGLHDGMGAHADYCGLLMGKAASVIAEYQETFAAQALALKAAKAMQQAETERADASEQDAKRYRWLRNAGMNERNMLEHYASHALDYAIDKAMARRMANIAASRMPKPDFDALRAINDGEDLPNGK